MGIQSSAVHRLMELRSATYDRLEKPLPVDGAEPSVEELLALHHISKTWGDRKVLDDVELILDRGTATWITGTNGIGKTTLVRIAVGLITPDEGLIDLDGLHPRRDRGAYQARVGFLAAGDRGLYARLTVRQHLEFWGRMSLLPRKEIDAAAGRVALSMGLGEYIDRRVDRLSMGWRQRLRIAMAFMHEPDVVLLDEPLNSLDEAGAQVVAAEVEATTGRGGAVLWCSPGTDKPPIDFDALLHLEKGKLHPVVEK